MRHIVDAIAAQGRHGDDTLIHVSKKELRLLKDIGDRIGIKSTTNPKTGLPEAFNWLGTLGGVAGGVLGTIVAPGAGTAAGAAMGSAAGTAAGGGTLKQSLTTGLISGVTAYAGGAALGSMAEAGAAVPVADAVAPAVTDAATTGVTDAATTGIADAATTGVTDATTNAAANTTTQAGTDATTNTAANTSGIASTGTPSSAAPPTTTPTVEPTAPTTEPTAPTETTPQDTGIKGPGLKMPQAGGDVGLKMPQEGGDVGLKMPEGGVKPPPTTKPEFSFKDVGTYLENTPTKDVVKQYGADLAKTAVGQGMVGMMPVGGISQPAPIEIPGKKQMASPKVEFYQGPEGELRTRAVPAMAQGGLAQFADYDAADAQSDGGYAPGGPIGYATGGSAGTAGGITTIPSPTTVGNQTAKTGNVLPAGFFSKEAYAKATPEQRATMDRLMAAQREMSPSPMRRPGYAGGGGIGFVRSMQPGGQWGDMTASMYGAVQEQKPQWLQNIEPGGFIGATVPGKMDYEDKKRAEEEAKKAEEKAKADAVKAQLKQQEDDRLNKIRGGSEIQQPQTAASGGLMGFARGRYLQGPGDGMSDSIPANIDGRQEARLATSEFVIPADVVSHLGNGSSEAGAKQLHAMMDRVRKARTGTKKQGKQINAGGFLPA